MAPLILTVFLSAFALFLEGCSSTASNGTDASASVTTTLPSDFTENPSDVTGGPSSATTTGFLSKTTTSAFSNGSVPSASSTWPVSASTTSPSFPASTQVPTARPQPGSQCKGKMLGTYTWSQDYWRDGNNQLFDFLNSPMGQEWNCGDVSVNIADSSNANKIVDEQGLVDFMVNFRRKTNNQGILWLTYGDVVSKRGALMVKFVQTFKNFLLNNVDANTMAEIAPIGLSFDVEHIDQEYIKEGLMDAQQMKSDLQNGLGYLPNSLYVQYTIEGAPDTLGTQYVMQYADSALMMLYRNEIKDSTGNNPDDLLGRLRWMLHEQCVVCTQPGWENLRAKITVMVEGSCKLGANCHKISMCAFDSASYPNPAGGIQYAWNTLQVMNDVMVQDGIVTQDQYNGLFNHEGTLFALHNWEWTKCYYGDSFSQSMGYNDYCPQYHQYAATCRAD